MLKCIKTCLGAILKTSTPYLVVKQGAYLPVAKLKGLEKEQIILNYLNKQYISTQLISTDYYIMRQSFIVLKSNNAVYLKIMVHATLTFYVHSIVEKSVFLRQCVTPNVLGSLNMLGFTVQLYVCIQYVPPCQRPVTVTAGTHTREFD